MWNKRKFGKYAAAVLMMAVLSGKSSEVNVYASEYANIPESDMAAESDAETYTEIETNAETEIDTETEANTETEQSPVNDKIKIEDSGVYQGMTRAYKDGYEPVISEGAVTIVIPIVADFETDQQEITVTPNLGDTAASPFVYKNYQKTFKKTKEFTGNGQEQKEVYLISYTLPLRQDRFNGVYPVIFDVSAKSGFSGITANFTIYVQITDGKNIEETEAIDIGIEEERPESQPKLILTKCTSTPGRIEAGSEFELRAEIKNTNKNLHIQNMTIEITWTEQGLHLLADSKTIFVERLGSEKTMEIPLKFRSEKNIAEGRYDITLNMTYDNPEAVSLTAAGTLSVDIHQPIKVEMEAGDLPSNVNAGDTFSIPIQALNLGRCNIYNARCTVDVPGLSSGTSLFLGNVEAGSAVNGEMKVFADMKDEAVYGEKYGQTSGVLILKYEDEEGNEHSQELDVSTVINQLEINPSAASEDDQEDSHLKIQWLIGVCAAVVLLAAAGIFFVRRKR